MRSTSVSLLLAGLVALAGVIPGGAGGQALDPVPYRMSPGSALEWGCFGPCACPIIISGPLTGGFNLYRAGVDPLFRHYALRDIAWTFASGDTGTEFLVHATGDGTYDLGGEVALMQRMTLDLTLYDPRLPPFRRHFDSGLVPTRAAFPAIDIDVPLNLDGCVDSVFRVVAEPEDVTAVEPPLGRRLLGRARPNPSAREVEIHLALPAAGHARVEVVDVRGRVVARLVDGTLAAGDHPLRWDGRDDRGADAGAGIFWIRARAGVRTDRERFVRLR